jgi:hypothetical protein
MLLLNSSSSEADSYLYSQEIPLGNPKLIFHVHNRSLPPDRHAEPGESSPHLHILFL